MKHTHKEHRSNNLVATLFLILLTSLVSANALAAQGGVVSDVVGYITAVSEDGKTRRLKSGDTVAVGETITAGENSSAKLTLADGTIKIIEALSSVVVEDSHSGGGFADTKSKLNVTSTSPSSVTSAGGGGTSTGDGGTPVQ